MSNVADVVLLQQSLLIILIIIQTLMRCIVSTLKADTETQAVHGG